MLQAARARERAIGDDRITGRTGARRPARRILGSVLPVLLAAGLVFAPAPAPASAPAQPRPIREVLQVEAGASCLSADALADTISSWLGRDTVDAAIATIDVRGDPARTEAIAIRIEIRGELVERSFDSAPPTCSDLHAVVGLAIAIAVDAAVLEGLGYEVVDPNEAAVPQARDSERPPLTRRSRRSEPSKPTPRRTPVSVAAAARGGVWVGVLPGIAGGGGAQIELGWRGWLDLRLGLWGGYGGQRLLAENAIVALGLVGGRVDACAALARPHLRPRLCFGPAAGALQVSAKSPGVRDAVGPWVGLVVAPELRIWATRRFALDLFVELVVPVVRPVLAERDPSKEDMIGASIAPPPVGAVIGIGAAFTIR